MIYLRCTYLVCLSVLLATALAAQDKISVKWLENQHVDKNHLEEFSALQIQDYEGRIKPSHTLALDILRKLYKKQSFEFVNSRNEKQEISAIQAFLSMNIYPEVWQQIPVIYVEPHLRRILQGEVGVTKAGYAKPSDFFGRKGQYYLQVFLKNALEKSPGKRDEFDKAVIKLDERVNIVWGVFSGMFLKVFPIKGDKNNSWASDVLNSSNEPRLLLNIYFEHVKQAQKNEQWQGADKSLQAIKNYQRQNADPDILLSDTKVATEIWFNNMQIFLACLIFYLVLGVLLLLNNFLRIFFLAKGFKLLETVLVILLSLIFTLHGFGIALRWYITGHAPWSNGYEATVFIAFIGILASLFYIKTTTFPLAAMSLIGVCLLGIAHGSLMNPEITPLVPVLKSYWLIIHVAIITGSYGFLALGSVLAFIVFLLFILMNKKQERKIWNNIHQLTAINQITTTVGLYMLAVGTFLGGVWANESWGRYWGWDPKETWALISIVIYSFVSHIRIIKPQNFLFLYNCCSLFAIGSLIMTFFGVNYYLSGLHSYAKGDSVPIPFSICLLVPVMMGMVFLAFTKYKKYQLTVNRSLLDNR